MHEMEPLSRDPNSMLTESTSNYIDYMSTDLINQSQPLVPMGLARYRSTPTSFWELLSGGGSETYDLELLDPTAVKEENLVKEKEREECVYQENCVTMQQENTCDLVRQTSSPAGFFSDLTAVENGFAVMNDEGNFRTGNGGRIPARRLNNNTHFSSGQLSSSRYMPQIAENGDGNSNSENEHLRKGNISNVFYLPSFQDDSWNESSLSGLKRNREEVDKFSGFNVVDNQNGKSRSYPDRLAHHLSLPKTTSELAAIEKYVQFQQDAVPCKIRAKRGHATHPRSIAERMRRTRISDRIKKLQDLFPNMDKQTNTADMLNQVVEYINDLQNQVQTLTGKKAECTCSK